jgi:hypothetical protein
MPGAAGGYAALDRLQSSLDVKRGQLRAIEDKIGPVWHPSGMSLGTTKRPLLLVGATVGGLLLVCLLWKLLVATLFATGLLGSGYEAEYKESSTYYGAFEITVRGKAAKLAVMLTGPEGHTETKIIEENEMITNSATVPLQIDHSSGTYVLTVKTFVPEGVVFKKEFRWPPETKELPRKLPRETTYDKKATYDKPSHK